MKSSSFSSWPKLGLGFLLLGTLTARAHYCILGQRYGWVPEPEQLKAREDNERQQVEKRSITDWEVRHAVLNDCRKRLDALS